MLKVSLPTKDCSLTQALKSLLDKCQSMAEVRKIHALTLSSALWKKDSTFASKIILFTALSESGSVDYSFRVLSQLSNPTSFDWNTVIRGYSRSKNPSRSISLFLEMLRTEAPPDHLTYPFLLKAAASLTELKLGESIHCRVLQLGFQSDRFIQNSMVHMYATCGDIGSARKLFDDIADRNLVSWNSMLDGYAKCGDIKAAREVFDSMTERDVVSWSSLIDGYVKSGDYVEALAIFERMRNCGVRANDVTMVSVLCACAHLGALKRGRDLHRYVEENRLRLTLVLKTSLVDMYAKCGAISEAFTVFRSVSPHKSDVLIWNAMIGGLATHGLVEESLEIFEEMKRGRVVPDEITYLCLLSACAHGGLVNEAWYFFERLEKHGLVPKAEHYACMVDVLARAGQVEEAFGFISKMPIEPTASMLGALLSGCMSHRKLELAEKVGKKLIEIEPDHDGRYVGLSNVYAFFKRWSEARNTREAMERRGVKKSPGFSCLEVFGTLHRFIAHDKTHPQSGQIYAILSFVTSQIKFDMEYESLEYYLSQDSGNLKFWTGHILHDR